MCVFHYIERDCIKVYTDRVESFEALCFQDNLFENSCFIRFNLKGYVWDKYIKLFTLKYAHTGVSCVQFDNKRIVSGSSDKTIRVSNDGDNFFP